MSKDLKTKAFGGLKSLKTKAISAANAVQHAAITAANNAGTKGENRKRKNY